MKRKSLAEERPEIGAQWAPNNSLSPYQVTCGSHKKVKWVCEKGHTWEAVIKNRVLLGSGCPYCQHRAVLRGYNDLLTVFPKVAKTWSKKNPMKPSEVAPGVEEHDINLSWVNNWRSAFGKPELSKLY